MFIYKIVNQINDKIYVGKTIRPLSYRWTQHLRDSIKFDYPLYRAMRKYGIENFSIEVIDTANSLEELNKKEADWIVNLESMVGQKGYNALAVDSRTETSTETRTKIGLISKNNWKNKEFLEKQRISRKLSYINSDKAEKHSNYMKKLWLNEDYRVKSLKAKTNRVKNAIVQGGEEFAVYKIIKYNGSLKNGRYIILDKVFIGTWVNQIQCGETLKIDRRDISACLNHRIKQTNGYIFERIKEK